MLISECSAHARQIRQLAREIQGASRHLLLTIMQSIELTNFYSHHVNF